MKRKMAARVLALVMSAAMSATLLPEAVLTAFAEDAALVQTAEGSDTAAVESSDMDDALVDENTVPQDTDGDNFISQESGDSGPLFEESDTVSAADEDETGWTATPYIDGEPYVRDNKTTNPVVRIAWGGQSTLSVHVESDTLSDDDFTYAWYYYDADFERVSIGSATSSCVVTSQDIVDHIYQSNRVECEVTPASGEGESSNFYFLVYLDTGLSEELTSPSSAKYLGYNEYTVSLDDARDEGLTIDASVDVVVPDQTITYHWLQDGNPVEIDESENTLQGADFADDVETISCVVRDAYGNEILILIHIGDGTSDTDLGDLQDEHSDVFMVQALSDVDITLDPNDYIDAAEGTEILYSWKEIDYEGYDSYSSTGVEDPTYTISLDGWTAADVIVCDAYEIVNPDTRDYNHYFLEYHIQNQDYLDSAQTLTAGGQAQVALNGATGRFVKFTPSISGVYEFYSSCTPGSADPYGMLYSLDGEGAYLFPENQGDDNSWVEDDGWGDGLNFRIRQNLTAGRTYYLYAGEYERDTDGVYNVGVYAGTEHQHQYIETSRTAPTCGSAGSVTCICSICGDSYSNTLPATGQHAFGPWTVAIAPTSAQEGLQVAKCSICGTQISQAIPKIAAPVSTITISKKPASVKAKAAGSGKINVSWKKLPSGKKGKALLKQIRKVEIQYSTDKTFATGVKTKNAGKSKTKVTLKGKKGKTLYVRVRYLDGKGGTSLWSAVKKVKVK